MVGIGHSKPKNNWTIWPAAVLVTFAFLFPAAKYSAEKGIAPYELTGITGLCVMLGLPVGFINAAYHWRTAGQYKAGLLLVLQILASVIALPLMVL